jgi:hypothetical protein
MMPFEAMEPERMAFLYELSKRSEGDLRRGVLGSPYEELIDALGFGERVTKRLQRALQQEGLVELTAVPRMTPVGRPVIDREPRRSRRQTIGMTHHGVRLREEVLSKRAHTAPPYHSASQAEG